MTSKRGRKRRITTYMSKSQKEQKNLHTRRTTVKRVHADLRKLATANSNKRLKKK